MGFISSGHGIRGEICVSAVTLQQALAFQVAGYARSNRMHQFG